METNFRFFQCRWNKIDSFLKISKIDLNMFKGDTSAIYDHKLEINPIKEQSFIKQCIIS